MATLLERLASPTPKTIKTIQVIATSIGSGLTLIAGYLSKDPSINLPGWVPAVLAIITGINHIVLQLVTQSDINSIAVPPAPPIEPTK